MSNFLAVATVTATLRRYLQAVVAADVSGATVTTVPLTASGAGLPQTGVNLLLYLVTPNASLRNRDLPNRRADGTLLDRPAAALDLHYLFSFYGDAATLEPQRVLGSVTRSLHAQPQLTRQMIRDTLVDPSFTFLAASDLAEEVELVRVTPTPLSLEQLFQLWSGVLQKADLALSTVYTASVVLLHTEESPSPALPVRGRTVLVQTQRTPQLDAVRAVAGVSEPIVVGSTLVLSGQRLRAEQVRVRIRGQEVAVPRGAVTDTEIRLALAPPLVDPSTLRAGVVGVQVVHPYLVGTPPVARAGAESNVAAFVLRPSIESLSYVQGKAKGGELAGTVMVGVTPPLAIGQRALLHLNRLADAFGGTQAYSFPVTPPASPRAELEVPVAGVAPGVYLVRLAVDGAESPLVADPNPGPTFGEYVEPSVEIGAE